MAQLLISSPWWRHQMETFSALLALCAGNSQAPDETQYHLTSSEWLSSLGWLMATAVSHPDKIRRHSDLDGSAPYLIPMMTSSNGNIFRVTGPLCGEFTGPGEFPAQRPVTRSFDVFFDLRPNKRWSKQPWGWWFETPSWSLWRQCNAITCYRCSMSFRWHTLPY